MKYNCECIDCGYEMKSDTHCSELKCPECGGQMRRKERPGPGQNSFGHNSVLISPEPQWNSIIIERLPDTAFAVGRDYPHHWIHSGQGLDEGGRYVSGVMYLSKGGVIEAYRQAVKDHAPENIINHLKNHITEAGIEIRDINDRPNIYQGRTGEIKMQNGLLPRIDDMDLNRIITSIDSARARSGDKIENREIEKINQLSIKPVQKEDIYIFPMWISNDLPDSYFTRMDLETTLKNYVEDFISGRGLMLSHAEDQMGGSPAEKMPLGSSFDARITTRPDKPGNWVEAWFYILRDIDIAGLKTNDVIRMIEAGIWRRASVGFTIRPLESRAQGKYICEICNNDMMSGDCEHLPGETYDSQLCIARIVGGSVREASLVYMNAAQGTVVQKARQLAEKGLINENKILSLEMNYGVRFFDVDANKKTEPPKGSKIVVPKRDATINEEKKMEELRSIMLGLVDMFSKVAGKTRAFADINRRMEKATDEAGLASIGSDLAENVRDLLNEAQSNRELVELIPEASRNEDGLATIIAQSVDGKSHRAVILEETIVEGVRFEGDKFDKDHWTRALESMSIEQLSHQRDLWKVQADSKLNPGQTARETGAAFTPPAESADKDKKTGTGIPDEAYSIGRSHI